MRVMNEHSPVLQFKLLMKYIMTVMMLRWWRVMKSGFGASFPMLVISGKIIFKQEGEKKACFPSRFKASKAVFFLFGVNLIQLIFIQQCKV